MKVRKTNFELLRIIAMCMIIAMHYMTKGMQLPKLSVDASLGNHAWWLFYGFCLVAPNAYVLISGYFLVDKWTKEWSWKAYVGRGIRLYAEVLFYSWIIPLVLGAFGLVNLSQIDFQTKITLLLPISEEHYWFATSYLLMYLLSPALSIGLRAMNKEQHKAIGISLFVVLSLVKSICPYLIPIDHYGCDVFWFVELFVIAAYIRRYGIGRLDTVKKSLVAYILLVVLYMAECTAIAFLVRSTGKLEYFMDMVYSYNHVLVLAASIAFFCIFIHMGEKEHSGRLDCIISKIGTYTFGVYLLHENLLLRETWFKWLGINKVMGCWYQCLHMLLCIIIVMLTGIIVDAVRTGLFRLAGRQRGLGE